MPQALYKMVNGEWHPIGLPVVVDPLAVPTNFVATGGASQVAVAWTPTADALADGYYVYASTQQRFVANDATNLVATIQGRTTTSYVHPTTSPVPHYFKIRAFETSPARRSGVASTSATPTVDPGGSDWRARANLEPDAGKVVFGQWSDQASLDALQTKWGIPTNLTRIYTGTGPVLGRIGGAQVALNAGRVPVISINMKNELKVYNAAHPLNTNGTFKTLFRWYADGHFDGDLAVDGGYITLDTGLRIPGWRRIVQELLKFTRGACPTNKFILTPWHEFENVKESGFGTYKSQAQGLLDFREAWQHLHQVATSMGLDSTRVLWGFCGATGVGSWGENVTATGSNGFFPGYDYVDVCAWDPYNSSGLVNASGGIPERGNSQTWQPFGEPGDHGTERPADRGTGNVPYWNQTINTYGQMSWHHRWFAHSPAEATASKPYRPIALLEIGTGDFDPDFPNDVTKRATTWFSDMGDWLASPGRCQAIKWVIQYNNEFNNVDVGLYRPTGFRGKGAHPSWQRVTTGSD